MLFSVKITDGNSVQRGIEASIAFAYFRLKFHIVMSKTPWVLPTADK